VFGRQADETHQREDRDIVLAMGSGTPVWRHTADASTLAALDPGVPPNLDLTPDVLVVGGGIVGLATAALCTGAGLGRVVLIERDACAAAASGRAGALLTPEPHVWTDPPAFVDLGRRSLDLWRILDHEWNGALGVEAVDWLVALNAPIATDADLGAKVEVLDAAAAHDAEAELGDDVRGALRIVDQARVHPLVAAAGFAARTDVATGVEMVRIAATGGHIATVHTSAGDFHPGAVVFATGVAPDVDGLAIPQQWIKGHLLATAPAPFRLRTSIAALSPGLVVQLPSGELIAGGTLDEGDQEPTVRTAIIDEIHDGLTTLLPKTASLEVAHAWCCFRPATDDHQPVIDRVPGVDNAWVTSGHFRTGILMAPATGDALARWIDTGTAPPEIAAFGVDRFSDK
jgi:glycine/D-amino acid oxidase-like deaminating enzyme